MAALESGYNLKATTLFGIKGDGVVLDTTEYIDGEYINIKDSFKCYTSLAESVQGLYELMQWEHYDRATSCIDYDEECRMVQACGYATDPEYANKLISIISAYQLTMFNNIEEPRDEPAEEQEGTVTYIVQRGDNMWQIVKDYYNLTDIYDISTMVNKLAVHNYIANPNMIYAGQILKMI